ncbi:TIGR03557 family F420-dependent LLM class oxidoreductase [Kitasatospora sp. NPDC006697]|uniref:TIGR03557 family F420-dependent LLM class oxidoreductase n=1 Tax=Kitasatospora sp. NPDC006697 TaxID=3364020 RepID=UPI00368D4731
MVRIGYTMMTEQRGPAELVDDVVRAEAAGFDFAVCSDHYFPWLAAQGHSPAAWPVLGAAARATVRIPLMSYVTCPTMRYHPVLVAQQAATLQLLSAGRFRLGLGSGENLNEHVIGVGWPPVAVRHEMLAEAVEIIRALFSGTQLSHRGKHFTVDSARLWDRPELPPPIGLAVSGPASWQLADRLADFVIAVAPEPDLVRGRPAVGQLPICYHPVPSTAIARAHREFRWFAGGWRVNAELPGPAAFDAASRHVRPEDVAQAVPCGDRVEHVAAAVRAFAEAGFAEVALLQIGGESQPQFIDWAERELLPALREEET